MPRAQSSRKSVRARPISESNASAHTIAPSRKTGLKDGAGKAKKSGSRRPDHGLIAARDGIASASTSEHDQHKTSRLIPTVGKQHYIPNKGKPGPDSNLVVLPEDIVFQAAELKGVLTDTSSLLEAVGRQLSGVLSDPLPGWTVNPDNLRELMKGAELRNKKLISMVDDINDSTAVFRDTHRVEEGVNTDSEYESDELVDDE